MTTEKLNLNQKILNTLKSYMSIIDFDQELEVMHLNADLKQLFDIEFTELLDDCPNYDNCTESVIENYEPQHNEGYD